VRAASWLILSIGQTGSKWKTRCLKSCGSGKWSSGHHESNDFLSVVGLHEEEAGSMGEDMQSLEIG